MQVSKTEISKGQLNIFVLCAKHFLNTEKEKSPLWIALDNLLPKMVSKLKKVETEREFIRISLCKKTATKHIETDKNGSYIYNEEDKKTLIQKLEALEDAKITVPTILINEEDVPTDNTVMTYDIRKAFEGIVIPKPSYLIEFEEELEPEEQEA